MKFIREGFDSFLENEPYLKAQWFFAKIVYAWLFLTAISMAPALDQLFTSNGYILPEPVFNSSRLMDQWNGWIYGYVSAYTEIIFFSYLGVLILGLTVRVPRLFHVITLVFHSYLMALSWATTDGAINLYELFLTYLILVNTTGKSTTGISVFSYGLRAVSNISFVFCRLQLVTVYAFAGLAKVTGSMWQNGTALYYILQGDYYSLPWVHEWLFAYPYAFVFATLTTVAFQISFVFLIWGRWRWLMVLMGSGLHLGIALFMGLVLFGLAMIMSYAVFIPESLATRIYQWKESLIKQRSFAFDRKIQFLKQTTSKG